MPSTINRFPMTFNDIYELIGQYWDLNHAVYYATQMGENFVGERIVFNTIDGLAHTGYLSASSVNGLGSNGTFSITQYPNSEGPETLHEQFEFSNISYIAPIEPRILQQARRICIQYERLQGIEREDVVLTTVGDLPQVQQSSYFSRMYDYLCSFFQTTSRPAPLRHIPLDAIPRQEPGNERQRILQELNVDDSDAKINALLDPITTEAIKEPVKLQDDPSSKTFFEKSSLDRMFRDGTYQEGILVKDTLLHPLHRGFFSRSQMVDASDEYKKLFDKAVEELREAAKPQDPIVPTEPSREEIRVARSKKFSV